MDPKQTGYITDHHLFAEARLQSLGPGTFSQMCVAAEVAAALSSLSGEEDEAETGCVCSKLPRSGVRYLRIMEILWEYTRFCRF